MIALILSVAAMVMAVAGLIYAGHCAIVFHRFNEGIEEWAANLDESTRNAIDYQAMRILQELDAKITAQNAENEDVESLNNQENEDD